MVRDAYDAGPDGSYPAWPRDAAGRSTMPYGLMRQRAADGTTALVDVTPRGRDRRPIGPADFLAKLAAEGIT